ncbi:MAG: AAA family ATPase, partial [Candidatus Marinimicrobia bacterium]|nr:AAA family ATPase [Candidatus Neomarinimicrobiota bacterium]
GVPGLAKTMMISSLAEMMDLKFSRIQFTPDLMPSDITGTEILEEDRSTGKRKFKFVKGPIFGNIILADEINRTPPKTQAALLEAMQENKVTAAGDDYNLKAPFFVLATQNPIEQEGTYPLPEAQLDRFMFSLNIQYPSYDEEIEIVKSTTVEEKEQLNTIINREEILKYQKLIRRVPVSDNVIEFAVKLAVNSRPQETSINFVEEWVEWGAGPRASQYLVLAAKARAALDGRPSPQIKDIIEVAKPVFRHRIIPNFNAEAEGVNSDIIVEKLIKEFK